ncbi:MAG TPA: adenylyl-sulfate kinase [Solirubrobacteraceae bacterium]|jgi:adenylyl-sulfate kinase|nr:adenylyl-sulfate kinase [Solirubrobacteraceae bacterium]
MSSSSSPNVTPHLRDLTRERRWDALHSRGATVWITGLPSAGKSTLGTALEEALLASGRNAYLLDGDDLRRGLCGDLGFSREDRTENVRRVGELARVLADSGTVAIVALVSPYARMREHVRGRHEADGLRFVEVFVDTPVSVCAERDPKGLYARAYAGELDGFTGVDDPYQAPGAPELRITPQLALDGVVAAVLDLLASHSP